MSTGPCKRLKHQPWSRVFDVAKNSLSTDTAAAMGSNPQILYTPQQQMGYGGFSVPCRVGNWAEDEYLGVLHTAAHVKKQGEGMLASQQLGSTLGAALAPASLAPAPADGAVKYGDVVMLSAASGGVLAADTITRMELPQEAYSVTRTRPEGAVACTRTAWSITPAPGTAVPEDGVLRIGVPFCLAVTGATGTVYLQSLRYTLHNQNFAQSAGKRKQGCCVVPAMSADTLWTVRVLDPTDLRQMESEGAPVPSNTYAPPARLPPTHRPYSRLRTAPSRRPLCPRRAHACPPHLLTTLSPHSGAPRCAVSSPLCMSTPRSPSTRVKPAIRTSTAASSRCRRMATRVPSRAPSASATERSWAWATTGLSPPPRRRRRPRQPNPWARAAER